MEIKARELKMAEVPGKTELYEVERSRDIVVKEKHDDGSLEQVILEYCMDEGDVGYFAKEYRPANVQKEGAKKVDITAVMLNHVKRCARWHLYDVKKTLAGEDVAAKLYNQWNSGLGYLQKNILDYFPGYSMKQDLGVITRYYDEGKMEQHRDEYQTFCDGMEKDSGTMNLARRKKRMDIGKCRARLKAVRAILDRSFRVEDEGDTYEIHIRLLHRENDKLYVTRFPI